VVAVDGEVNKPSVVVVVRHPIADALLGQRRVRLDDPAHLAEERLRLFGRSRDVIVDLVFHLPDFNVSSSS
jgi:hypothetical protein